MRILTVSTAALVAALLALPAGAQQSQLPRPGQQAPAPQKGLAPGPDSHPGRLRRSLLHPLRRHRKPRHPRPRNRRSSNPPWRRRRPTRALAVTPPKSSNDPTLAAFRQQLIAIAQKKDRAALARLVLARDFFWLKEDGNAAGKKSGIEALATALSLAAKDGSGWETLGDLRRGRQRAGLSGPPEHCLLSGRPRLQDRGSGKACRDDQDRHRRVGLHLADDVEVRQAAQANSPVIEKLGMAFVRVMPDTAPNASQEFMRIVTPSGKVGFVAAEAINPLGSDQLCFGKDAAGAWKIVGMIGGE